MKDSLIIRVQKVDDNKGYPRLLKAPLWFQWLQTRSYEIKRKTEVEDELSIKDFTISPN